MATLSLTLRSLLWVVLLPVVVAGYVPWRFFGLRHAAPRLNDPLHLTGLVAMTIGVATFAWCVWDFARRGRGTLSPADPPRILVVHGVYRYVRNPMYLGVTLILLGEAALMRSPPLLLYWCAWFLAVNVFVIAYEEPFLRRRFGDAYAAYTARVGRWLPRARARSGRSNDGESANRRTSPDQ